MAWKKPEPKAQAREKKEKKKLKKQYLDKLIVHMQDAKNPKEIRKILSEFRRVFARSDRRKYWSILDSPAWRKKEAKYIEDLSKGKLR